MTVLGVSMHLVSAASRTNSGSQEQEMNGLAASLLELRLGEVCVSRIHHLYGSFRPMEGERKGGEGRGKGFTSYVHTLYCPTAIVHIMIDEVKALTKTNLGNSSYKTENSFLEETTSPSFLSFLKKAKHSLETAILGPFLIYSKGHTYITSTIPPIPTRRAAGCGLRAGVLHDGSMILKLWEGNTRGR